MIETQVIAGLAILVIALVLTITAQFTLSDEDDEDEDDVAFREWFKTEKLSELERVKRGKAKEVSYRKRHPEKKGKKGKVGSKDQEKGEF